MPALLIGGRDSDGDGFDARIGRIQQKYGLGKSNRRQKFQLIRNGG